jgi:hypothetical protein
MYKLQAQNVKLAKLESLVQTLQLANLKYDPELVICKLESLVQNLQLANLKVWSRTCNLQT